jgi:hypothetical protein
MTSATNRALAKQHRDRSINKDVEFHKQQLRTSLPPDATYSYNFTNGFVMNFDADEKNDEPAMIKAFGVRAVMRMRGRSDYIVIIEPDMYLSKNEVLLVALRRFIRHLDALAANKANNAMSQKYDEIYESFVNQEAVEAATSATVEEQKVSVSAVEPPSPPALSDDEQLEALLASQEAIFKKEMAKAEKKQLAEAEKSETRRSSRKH